MEEIIKKAIEVGYKPDDVQPWLNKETVLDHLFWQSLGKACGWEGAIQMQNRFGFRLPAWQHEALRFHEINLTQGWVEAVKWLQNLIKE